MVENIVYIDIDEEKNDDDDNLDLYFVTKEEIIIDVASNLRGQQEDTKGFATA